MCIHIYDERGKLGMAIDRRFNGCLVYGEIEISGPVRFEQDCLQSRTNCPIQLQSVDISGWDAAFEMSLDVLYILSHLAIYVAGKVEVEVIFLLDFLDADHARVFRGWKLFVKSVDDFVDVLRAQTVLRAVLHEAGRGVDHENAFARLSVLLIDDDDACGNPCAEKQVRRQSDDALDVAFAHE